MSKVSVLVVDDATFIRDLVKKGLRNYFPGIHTEDAVNGRKAQALLSKESFDLILCDWEMPEMSGLELLTWCREQDNYLKTVPFIMVTSRGDKENVVQAIQAGVTDFVGKPFTNEQLLSKVKKALAKVGKLDAVMSTAPARMNSPLNDSLSALTGGKAEVVRATSAAAPASIPKAPPVAAVRSAEPTGRGQGQLRLPNGTQPCVIKALSLKDATLVVRVSEK
ncbi:response regulator, partial [Pseudomonas syringae pv. actinidiae ICMP 19096]